MGLDRRLFIPNNISAPSQAGKKFFRGAIHRHADYRYV
jgi:hypothetical protein